MRRSHWFALAAAGILLGCLLTLRPITGAAPRATASEASANPQEETVNQLKEINARLKELGPFLCSGKVRVTVVINADVDREAE